MRSAILALGILLLFAACKSADSKPDVSRIVIKLETQRFEQDLFAIDTNNLVPALATLSARYPVFMRDFMANILGIPPGDPQAAMILKKFITDFRPVKAATDARYRDFSRIQGQVVQLLQFTKHYFPQYPTPSKLITFVGPMDAFYESSLGWSGDIITADALGVGLQMHLGAASPLYAEDGGKGYPQYISRRFEPEYIVVNCARNIVDDMYPEQPGNKTLLDQMVDKGKRIYLVSRLLPDIADSLIIGYTGRQLAGAKKNEGLIWNMFTENNLLFETDYQKIKTFIGEGPKTPELGDDSPGYISLFTGWQIVRKYMDLNPSTTLDQLMKTEGRKILESSRYKPK